MENYKLIVSPDDEYMAEQCGKAIYLIRRNTRKVFQVIPLEGISTSFVFSPDSKNLIVADSNGKISIWEIETGVCQNVIETQRKSIKNIYISHDGKTLCLDNGDAIELYKINTGECVRAFNFRVELLGFGPDDRSLVGMNANSIEVIDIHDGKTLRSFDFKNIAEAALSPGKNQILVVDAIGKITIFDLKTGHTQEIQLISRFSSGSMAIDSSGRTILLCSQGNESYLELWNLETHNKTDIPGKWEDVQISPDEKMFYAKESDKGKFSFWNIQNGNQLFEINPDGNLNVVEPVISNGHGLMITSGYQEGATLWDLKTGHDQHHFTKYSRNVFNAYFSQNEKLLLTDCWPDRINLWDTETGSCLRRWQKYPYQLQLAFAPDNHLLAYIAGEEIIVENILYEQLEYKLSIGDVREIKIKFSDDNNFLYQFSIDPSRKYITYLIYQAKTGNLIKKHRHENIINQDTKFYIDFTQAHLYVIDAGRITQTNLITGEDYSDISGTGRRF